MEDLIQSIITVLQQDGELATDGECLDQVATLLTEAGYKVF